MTEKELYDLLSTIKVDDTNYINVAYDHFLSHEVAPPFILYRNTDTTTFKADDKVYCQMNQYIIDLITEVKDTVLENKLETLLNDNCLAYDKTEDFIDDERIYQIRYFI